MLFTPNVILALNLMLNSFLGESTKQKLLVWLEGRGAKSMWGQFYTPLNVGELEGRNIDLQFRLKYVFI